MKPGGMLADFDHPTIQTKANELTSDKFTLLDKVESLFLFVRDEILFGFPPKWDEVRASETLEYKIGYCNTKATLLLALCKSIGIDARLHTGLIDIDIMRGIFPHLPFHFFPAQAGIPGRRLQSMLSFNRSIPISMTNAFIKGH